MTMMIKFGAWGMVFVWILLIYTMTFKEGSESAELSLTFVYRFDTLLRFIGIRIEENILHTFVRKSAHVTVYFFLGLWVINALSLHHISFKETMIVGFFIVLAVASIDETFQLFVEGRHGSLLDVMYDMFGATLGGGIMLYFKMKRDLL